mmetsp:Transcript_8900/g.14830  ORF Transcript_8900/g.14830 Transcript_8900/m.14830 type:complete len:283 (-) Transcript_8900:59-907(-)
MVQVLSLSALLWGSMIQQGKAFQLLFPGANPSSLPQAQQQQDQQQHVTRRQILSWTTATCSLMPLVLLPNAPSAVALVEDPVTITLRLERGERAGVELYDTFSGDLSRQVVAIKSVSAEASSKQVVPGMVITNFQNSKSVVERLQNGPYPVDLNMINPTNQGEFVVRTVRPGSGAPSRRDDLLEFVYEARMGSPDGPVYDSSAKRGTGQPYQYILGSGNLIPGVDAGLLKMQPGEVRQLELPPPLAYGSKGSKLYEIPPNTKLYWLIKMIRVNSVGEASSDP